MLSCLCSRGRAWDYRTSGFVLTLFLAAARGRERFRRSLVACIIAKGYLCSRCSSLRSGSAGAGNGSDARLSLASSHPGAMCEDRTGGNDGRAKLQHLAVFTRQAISSLACVFRTNRAGKTFMPGAESATALRRVAPRRRRPERMRGIAVRQNKLLTPTRTTSKKLHHPTC